MRALPVLLALVLAVGAFRALQEFDPSQSPEALAFAALNQPQPDLPKAIRLYTEALQRDSANPYRWSDLGQALLAAGDTQKARACYRRALELSRQVPQVWLRDANFHFELDEPEDALRSAALVLKTVPDYDAVLFGYFDRLVDSPSAVLVQIGGDRRATRSYVQHLIGIGNMDSARDAWEYALAHGFNDDLLTVSYIDGLLRAHRYVQAKRDWSRSLGKNRGDYPNRNLIFNGGFEREPSGCALDWRIQPSEAFETTRTPGGHEGKWSLRIQFRGNANVSYDNVVQMTPVRPGNYVLRAWVRSDGITTNEGPRIAIQDAQSPNLLNIKSDSFLGTAEWTPVTIPFTVGRNTSLISIRVIRDLSQKFDSKINGTVWLDSITLAAVSGDFSAY